MRTRDMKNSSGEIREEGKKRVSGRERETFINVISLSSIPGKEGERDREREKEKGRGRKRGRKSLTGVKWMYRQLNEENKKFLD